MDGSLNVHYYEHHIGDYDADTAHLSWLEDMAYTRLLRLYYRKELPVPADVAEACRLVRAVTREQKQAVESVLKEFFRLEADGWHQKRCDADVERYQKKAERNREVGKLGGRPRKVETQTEPTNNPGGLQQEPKQNPLQTPDTRHQKEKTRKRATSLPDGFSVSERVRLWAAEKGHGNLDAQLEALTSYAKRKGATYVDWDEALMTAVRDDWAKVGKTSVPTFEGVV